MYLLCYPLVLRNKYTDEITYIYTSDLRGDIINLQNGCYGYNMDFLWHPLQNEAMKTSAIDNQ